MKTVESDIVEKIISLSEKLLRLWEKNIFNVNWITILQFNILWEVLRHKEISINKLKKNIILSCASLSQVIKRMEKLWFVKRRLWEDDRREIVLTASKKWYDIYHKLNGLYINMAKQKFKNISKEFMKETFTNLCIIEKNI